MGRRGGGRTAARPHGLTCTLTSLSAAMTAGIEGMRPGLHGRKEPPPPALVLPPPPSPHSRMRCSDQAVEPRCSLTVTMNRHQRCRGSNVCPAAPHSFPSCAFEAAFAVARLAPQRRRSNRPVAP